MAKCIVCKGDYTPGSLCPRCGADNGPWERWQTDHRGLGGWMDFMAPGLFLPVILTALAYPVGLVALRSLWLTKGEAWPWALPLLGILTFVCLLIPVVTYAGRYRLREHELMNQVRQGPSRYFGAQSQILAVPLTVVVALSVWTWIILSQRVPGAAGQNYFAHLLSTVHSEGLFSAATRQVIVDIVTLKEALSIGVLGYMSLLLAAVYSSSLFLVQSYAERMNQQVPLPIFADTARLGKVVRAEAEQVYSTLGPKLVWEGIERTEDGGIKLTARYRQDRKILEDLAGKKTDLPLHTKCEVLAGPWGHIRSIKPESELQV